MNKQQNLTVEQFIPIKDIDNKKVILKDGQLVAYIYIYPKDISLKRDIEKQMDVKNYSNIYKNIQEGDIQTISVASTTDVSELIEHLESIKSDIKDIKRRKMIHDEIQYVIEESLKTVERNTYLVIKSTTREELNSKLETLLQNLKTAQVHTKVLNDNEIKQLLFAYYNQEYKGKIKEFYV